MFRMLKKLEYLAAKKIFLCSEANFDGPLLV